jgi:para-aminobenzoate synthetase / 4-amino-4-deoxychorismate lyase
LPVHALIRDADAGHWLALTDPVAVLIAESVAQVPTILNEAERRVRDYRLYAVGMVTYEAAPGVDPTLATHPPGRLPPAWFALFDRAQPAPPPIAAASLPDVEWQPSLDAAGYRTALDRIRTWIAAGDTYQVNFSYRLRTRLPAAAAAGADALFAAMIDRQPAGYGAWIDTDAWTVCSASHELFFARRGRTLTSRPMKGTAPRGRTAAEDDLRARWLRQSLKNRAENLMITDMVRNDLGRIADVGSVRTADLFRLEPYPTLWQLTSTVRADSDASLADVFAALFPAASITGAPKHRTMAIIRELEPAPREIYTGSIGLLRPDGSAQFNVAIRTVLVDKHGALAEYGIGGGILWDSDADDELAETHTKARILYPDTVCSEPFELLETLLWQPDAGCWLQEAHLARLAASAAFFGFPLDRDRVMATLHDAVAGLPPERHRLRLRMDESGAVTVTAATLPDGPPFTRVALARRRLPLQNEPFVLHKTTRRGIYQRALAEARAQDATVQDVLLINEHGEVTESTIANLLVDVDGELITPPVASGLLPGVYRQWLLARGEIRERAVTPAVLARARAVYLLNSVRGRWPVTVSPAPGALPPSCPGP